MPFRGGEIETSPYTRSSADLRRFYTLFFRRHSSSITHPRQNSSQNDNTTENRVWLAV
jgi:hypothetical protein